MSATSPAVGPQASNGVPRNEHGRKQSVVITAAGTSGQTPNGGPVGQNVRPNINFGSMAQGSPAIVNSVPYSSQTASLPAPRHDPRITSPAHSPSPIPQPPASGGKPPSLQGQGNGLSFGSMGMENGASAQGPLTPGQQPAHIRRESTQSHNSDMSAGNMNRNFVPPQGRGRGGYMPQFSGASPAQNYRPLPSGQPRGPPNMQPQFQGQGQQMGNQQFRGGNSPARMHAQPNIPQGMQHQMQYGGYPQHLGPQQQSMYGMQAQFDPYSGYYQPYYGHSQFPQGAPPSPRPGQQYPAPYGGPPQNMASPYHPPSMSRSASQISERPASSLGSRPPPGSTGGNSSHPPTPAPSTGTPAPPSSNFQIPTRTKSKAIVIKNAAGEEIKFDKKPSPTPVAQPQSPAIVSSVTPSAPTPPPRTPSVTHNRAESKSTKVDAETTKNAFQEQVKKQLEAQREVERKAKEEEEGKATKDKSESDAKAAREKSDADAKAASEAKAQQDKVDADAKAAKDKEDAEAKVKAEKEKAEAAAKEAKDKSDAEAAAQADNAKAVVEAEKAAADKTQSDEDEAARAKREEDERLEREIAEMEALEKEEEERERAYNEKKKAQQEEQKKRDAEKAANADEEMKRLEREAEAREEAKEKEREEESKVEPSQADKDLFASLKKPSLGPGANESGADTPDEDDSAAPVAVDESAATQVRGAGAAKPKPAHLKLQTDKPVEPAQPTPGMQSLRSARLLDLQRDNISYPDGFKSPNPALNTAAKRGGRQYDKDFLLQFQEVFREKPTVDWDSKVKETLADGEPSSARAGSGRTPSSAMGPRQASNRTQASGFGGPMGSFGGGGARTLPPNTTSQERFMASQQGTTRPTMNNPLAGFAAGRGGFPMGAQMGRTGSMQNMAPPSPRSGTASRGGKGSRRGPADRNMSRKEEEQAARTMPLTAGMELKGLEKSTTGWTARSVGQAGSMGGSAVGPDGAMPPDMVQRKVKAALNKMTPEKFDKISDQIMEIAGQSRNESDGRTLRQVIQLTFEKACDEAHWAGMYAKFCQKMLTSMSNDIVDETIRDKNGAPVVGGGLFRKYLLNRCQEEFERGWEANLPEKPEGETEEAALLSEEYYKAEAAKRRGLGLIQFIGELYKLGMLTYRIMHQCVLRLLNFDGQPDESAVENLARLLRTVGAAMDSSDDQGHGLVNAYFDRIKKVLDTHQDMPSRPRFMLMDLIDLRKKNWAIKDSLKGPKTIQEIHAEAEAAAAAAEAERSRTNTRGGHGGGGRMGQGRGDARNFSQGMPPPDYPRNQVGMDDLRRLQNRGSQANRQASSGLGPSLGPGSSLYAGRSSSGRKGLGPPKDGDVSGGTSRTGTPPIKKEETNTSANAFSALAALENEGGETVGSPPSEKASPSVVKATPSIDAAADTEPSS